MERNMFVCGVLDVRTEAARTAMRQTREQQDTPARAAQDELPCFAGGWQVLSLPTSILSDPSGRARIGTWQPGSSEGLGITRTHRHDSLVTAPPQVLWTSISILNGLGETRTSISAR